MLVFNINMEVYMGIPLVQLRLTLAALIGQSQGHLDFDYFMKELS